MTRTDRRFRAGTPDVGGEGDRTAPPPARREQKTIRLRIRYIASRTLNPKTCGCPEILPTENATRRLGASCRGGSRADSRDRPRAPSGETVGYALVRRNGPGRPGGDLHPSRRARILARDIGEGPPASPRGNREEPAPRETPDERGGDDAGPRRPPAGGGAARPGRTTARAVDPPLRSSRWPRPEPYRKSCSRARSEISWNSTGVLFRRARALAVSSGPGR
jgi:hypothetical protein